MQVNEDSSAPLQAIGRDGAGRAQYLYSVEHSERAAVAKFQRLARFESEREAILASCWQEIEQGGPHAEEASCLVLIDATGLRVGSERDTRAKAQAYGASTLRGEHVAVSGDTVTLTFTGKCGVRIERSVRNARIASMMERRRGSGRVFGTSDSRVRDYMHSIDGHYKVKDFRTRVGTAAARDAISRLPVPKSKRDSAKARMRVARAVSAELGNTPRMALSSYIDPRVFQAWENAI